MLKLHPIHFALVMGVLSLVGGFVLALQTQQPLVFVLAIVCAYLLGSETVGKFSGEPTEPEGEQDYQETNLGFMKDVPRT